MAALEDVPVAEREGHASSYCFGLDHDPGPAQEHARVECTSAEQQAELASPDPTGENLQDSGEPTSSAQTFTPPAAEASKSSAAKRPATHVNGRYVPQAKINAELKKLKKLSQATLTGDTSALDALREALDRCPHIWRRLSDLQLSIEKRFIQLVAGKDPLREEAFRKRCSELRCELLEREPCTLATEMAASRVVATFMFVQLLELRALQTPDELRNIKQLEQAERRFQVAMRTFQMCRRSELQLRTTA